MISTRETSSSILWLKLETRGRLPRRIEFSVGNPIQRAWLSVRYPARQLSSPKPSLAQRTVLEGEAMLGTGRERRDGNGVLVSQVHRERGRHTHEAPFHILLGLRVGTAHSTAHHDLEIRRPRSSTQSPFSLFIQNTQVQASEQAQSRP
jgi:hypothetical protein